MIDKGDKMKNLLYVCAFVFLAGCGSKHYSFSSSSPTDPSCTVSSNDSMATITCPDGTSTTVIAPSHAVLYSIEDANNECKNGGKIINIGADSNNNTLLDSSEISSTLIVCNVKGSSDYGHSHKSN